MGKTMMAKPPIHCVMLRHSRMSFGTVSMQGRMVAPVVVKPDSASKKASVKLGTLLLSRYGMAPKSDNTSHEMQTM